MLKWTNEILFMNKVEYHKQHVKIEIEKLKRQIRSDKKDLQSVKCTCSCVPLLFLGLIIYLHCCRDLKSSCVGFGTYLLMICRAQLAFLSCTSHWLHFCLRRLERGCRMESCVSICQIFKSTLPGKIYPSGNQEDFRNWLKARQVNQSHYYNRNTKELPECKIMKGITSGISLLLSVMKIGMFQLTGSMENRDGPL